MSCVTSSEQQHRSGPWSELSVPDGGKGSPTRDSSTGINKGAWGWKPSFHYELCALGLSLFSSPSPPL